MCPRQHKQRNGGSHQRQKHIPLGIPDIALSAEKGRTHITRDH